MRGSNCYSLLVLIKIDLLLHVPGSFIVLISKGQRLWKSAFEIVIVVTDGDLKWVDKCLFRGTKLIGNPQAPGKFIGYRLNTKSDNICQRIFWNGKRESPVRGCQRAACGSNLLGYLVTHGRANFCTSKYHLSIARLPRKQDVAESAGDQGADG